MLKTSMMAGAILVLSFMVADAAAAQSGACSSTGGYPEGSPGAVMARLRNIADGSYAACVERGRAQELVVSLTQAQVRAAARRAVVAELRDPSSAQFRNVRRIQHDNGTTQFCGEVNARNGFGGMAGFQRFEAGVTNRGTVSAQIDSNETSTGPYFDAAWNQFCGRLQGLPIQF